MNFGRSGFGSIEIDGTTYRHDVVIEGDHVRTRDKDPSRARRAEFGHVPLTAAEDIPWSCRRLVVGIGADGMLPIAADVWDAARDHDVELVVAPTAEAIELLRRDRSETNAILHLTC